MNAMLRLLILLSVSDSFAYIFRGNNLIGAYISNTVYFLVMALGSFVWFLFICTKTDFINNLKRTIYITGTPFFILFIGVLTNPLHNLFFTFDELFLYHRGNGIYFVWFVEWGYMIAAFIVNIIAVRREKRHFVKSEYMGYLMFAIPSLIAAAVQMFFYGTTTIQIGFMMGLLLAYLNKQHFQVQRDALTGLNNKNAFLRFRDTFALGQKKADYTVFMIDVDKFKTINDYYGHLKGDQALCDIAKALDESVKENYNFDLELYRYAGDEFAIVGVNVSSHVVDLILNTINFKLEKRNQINHVKGEKYYLSLSIGFEHGFCESMEDFDKLTALADKAMYKIKKEKGSHSA